MKSALDLARRYLELADRDIAAFNKMKGDPVLVCNIIRQSGVPRTEFEP